MNQARMLPAIVVLASVAGQAEAQYCAPGPYYAACMNQQRQREIQQQQQQQRQMQMEQQQRALEQQQQMQQQQQQRQIQMEQQQRALEQQQQMRQQQQLQRQQVQRQPTIQSRPGQPRQAASMPQHVGNPQVRVTNAHPYVYRGRSFSPVRVGTYRWPAGVQYHRYGVGGRLPRSLIIAAYVLANWAAYGLTPPPPGYEWLRYGPDVLAVDPDTGAVVDAAYGVFYEDDSMDQAAAPPPPPQQFYWIGIAWNNSGGWATRSATSAAEAQQSALDACNQIAGNCYNASSPVPGDRYMCWALYQDGNDEYEHHDPNLQVAINDALQNCQGSNDPGPGCQLRMSSCNDHP